MTAKIKIDTGIPLLTYGSTYPFRTMKVGDSFLWEGDPATVRASISNYKKRHPRFNFTTRKVDGGTRVWRIK